MALDDRRARCSGKTSEAPTMNLDLERMRPRVSDTAIGEPQLGFFLNARPHIFSSIGEPQHSFAVSEVN